MAGKLIVIEGLDGSGKATQAQLVYENLLKQGVNVKKISFPDYSQPSSSLVQMYLKGEFGENPLDVNAYTASSFYAVDRAASFLKFWKKDYENDAVILADRYTTSNEIYQLSKLTEDKKEEFLSWLEDFEYGKLKLPSPDAVIYLDVKPKVSQKLLSERYSGDESQKDIHEKNVRFLDECRNNAMYSAEKLKWHVVDCCDGDKIRAIEDINRDIMNIISEVLFE